MCKGCGGYEEYQWRRNDEHLEQGRIQQMKLSPRLKSSIPTRGRRGLDSQSKWPSWALREQDDFTRQTGVKWTFSNVGTVRPSSMMCRRKCTMCLRKSKQCCVAWSPTSNSFFPWHSVVQVTLRQSACLQIPTPPLRTLYGLGLVTWPLVLQFPQQQNREVRVLEA